MELTKLKKVVNILTGFPFEGDLYSDTGIRVVRGENITEGRLRWDTIKCWNLPFNKKDFYSLKEDDVVIGMDGSKVGKNKARIKKENLPLILAQRVACLRAKETLNQIYLFYCINNDRFEDFVFRIQTGSSIPHISKTQIEDFSIPFHDLKTQKQVAKVLSDLDAKIELNNKINRELEAMAKTLYDYWFVQFDFPDINGKPYKSSGGKMVYSKELKREMPEGWEVGNILKVATLLGGGTPKTNNKSYWNGSIPFFTPSDAELSIFSINTEQIISQEGLNSCSSKLFNKGTVFLTARGTVGKVNVASKPMAMNQSCYAFVGNEGIQYPFLYFFTTELVHFIKAKASGSIFKAIVSNDIKLTILFIPPKIIIENFNKTVESIFEKILVHKNEKQELASLRNWLLPMLMNGQVKVADSPAEGKVYQMNDAVSMAAEAER